MKGGRGIKREKTEQGVKRNIEEEEEGREEDEERRNGRRKERNVTKVWKNGYMKE